MWDLKTKQINRNKLMNMENKMVVVVGGVEGKGKIAEGDE